MNLNSYTLVTQHTSLCNRNSPLHFEHVPLNFVLSRVTTELYNGDEMGDGTGIFETGTEVASADSFDVDFLFTPFMNPSLAAMSLAYIISTL